VRIQVEVINTKQLINYNKALCFVKKVYAAFVCDDRRKIRYLEHYEQMRLRDDMRNARYEQCIDNARGGPISGEWRATHSVKKPTSGGPQCRTMQYMMTVRSR